MVEALACGVPVLISREVNIWREVVENGAGFAEADSVVGTTELLQRWLALTPMQRGVMRAAASRCFAEQFEIEEATEHLLRLLNGREPESRAGVPPAPSEIRRSLKTGGTPALLGRSE